jgi:hypothetical protein
MARLIITMVANIGKLGNASLLPSNVATKKNDKKITAEDMNHISHINCFDSSF